MSIPLHVRQNIQFRRNQKEITSCWIWNGPLSSSGYPVVNEKGETLSGRIYIYEKYKKKVKENEFLKPTCKARLCVNPNHFELRKDAKK